MKGLILAAGLGTRLRPITSLRPKPLITVANKPIILHAVDNLVAVGITDIAIVVSPLTKPYLQDALEDYPQANFNYILQDPPEGLAHAVKVSRDFLGDESFMMYLGDNLFEEGIIAFKKAFESQNCNVILALTKVANPKDFGVAVVEEGRVISLIEKPSNPPSDLAVAGVYVFDSSIHEVIDTLPRGAKNEFQITDAIQALITKGGVVSPVEIKGWWKDTGKPEDILDANRLLLLKIKDKRLGKVENSDIVGEVIIETGAIIKNSKIVGPVIIGKGAYIENAYIGPFTSIGEGTRIVDAEVEYAVVEQRSSIVCVKTRLQSSLIGADVEITSRDSRPKTHQLIIGDKSLAYLNE